MTEIDEGPATGRRVAVMTHIHRPEAVTAARRFVEGIVDHHITACLPAADIESLGLSGRVEALDPDAPVADVEVAVVFGGDGTILRGAEWALVRDVPLLGVNLGHVGFLAEAESHEIDQVVDQVIARSWIVEERLTARVQVRAATPVHGAPDHDAPDHGDPEGDDSRLGAPHADDRSPVVWESFAVNEVSMEKAARERMLEVMVSIDDHPLSRWGCDGVLVATPTGSTAYAFSAGGPVMWPEVEALLVVPLSAHALFARPMVLGPTSTVTVDLLGFPDALGVVWCDGRRSFDLRAGMRVEVVANDRPLRLARLSPARFTDRLVRKFGLRVEGWRGAAEQARP